MFYFLSKSLYLKQVINHKKAQLLQWVVRYKNTLNISNEYQYIQMSKVPTMHFQPSLPRLPIPKLENSCQKYINAHKPLVSTEKLSTIISLVTEFLKNEGPKLQKELLYRNKINYYTSYISDLWFDMYLKDRKPLPINYNPMLVFAPESNPQYNSQLVKATNLIISSARFMKSLKMEILEPEVYHMNPEKSDTPFFRTVTKLLPSSLSWYGAYLFKAYPLDMSQYSSLFNTTRIPQLGKDKIYHDTSAKHIIVMRRGYFYTFDIFDENDYIRKPNEIASCLQSILQDKRLPNESPVGIMTTSDRDKWSIVRSDLMKIGNEDILKKIDSAAFLIILDDEHVGDDYKKLIRTYLHGDGTNRWFDKSFSLIITKDGHAGINFEHSWGDGVAVLRFFNDIKNDISKQPRFHPECVSNLSKDTSVGHLNFLLDTKIKNTIDEERKRYDAWTKQLCVGSFIYDGFGKDECKKIRISSDAIMQLAFQLALYSQECQMVSTYESCSTAAFKHGRTETIRSCTEKTKEACIALSRKDCKLPISQLKTMISDCSNLHTMLTKEAAMGQGFDRHLFALKRLCEESGTQMPAIFKHPSYAFLNHIILSTSTLSSPVVIAGGFGPVVPDGYGIGYMIQDKRLGAVVTSYQGSRNANDYVEYLKSAFKTIHKVITSN